MCEVVVLWQVLHLLELLHYQPPVIFNRDFSIETLRPPVTKVRFTESREPTSPIQLLSARNIFSRTCSISHSLKDLSSITELVIRATNMPIPTFSAQPSENIQEYLQECTRIRMGHLTFHEVQDIMVSQTHSEEMKSSIALQVLAGLRGEASTYTRQFDMDALTDLKFLSRILKGRFPSRPRPAPASLILLAEGMGHLRQGRQSIGEYAGDLRRLRAMLPEGANNSVAGMLVMFWVAGLANNRLRSLCCAAMVGVDVDALVSHLENLFDLPA